MPTSSNQPGERPPPTTIAELLDEICDRNGYRNLAELSKHTTIPYKTLWSWRDGSRSAKRPPSVEVLRKFAGDVGMPEAIVLRAAGRTYNDPGAIEGDSLELVKHYKSLPADDQVRLLRIVAIFGGMSTAQRKIAESVVRAVARPEQVN